MAKKKSNIIDIRHQYGKTINLIELILFGAITIYIIVLIYMYFHSNPVRGYEIQMGSLSTSKYYTGLAIREEEIVKASHNGYINFYVREGERVSSRDYVYSIDESGKLSGMLHDGELGSSDYTDEQLKDFKEDIIQFQRVFSHTDFKSVYDFKYSIDGDIMQMVNVAMFQNMEQINKASLNGLVNLCTTSKSGYFVCYTDGYESITPDQLSMKDFDKANYEKNRLNHNDLVDADTPVGKLITSEKWSLAIPVDEEYAKFLEEEKNVKVKFVRTQDVSWAQTSIQRNEDGIYAILTMQNSCTTFAKDRYVEIEVMKDEPKGLKIPKSAIAEKTFFIIPSNYMIRDGANDSYAVKKEFFDENGTPVYKNVETTVYASDDNEFYVDNGNLSVGDRIYTADLSEELTISKSGKLLGVYNMNKGYTDFKQITILYENEDYAIVSSNTKYGLTVYDRIVLDAKSVDTGDFIFN